MSNAPTQSEDIRKQMAQIRRDLHADVRGVVEGAEAATDWKRFVRNYPWACMGAAVAVGYLVVPRKHRATTTLQVAPAEIARAASIEPAPLVETKPSGKGWVGTVFGLVAPVALRAVQGYALQFAEQWMAQKVAEQMQQHPDLAAAFGAQARDPRAAEGLRATPPAAPRF